MSLLTRATALLAALVTVSGAAAGTALASSHKLKTATSASTSTASALPASCPTTYSRLVPVSSASALSSALSHAVPGDEIVLADGTYVGHFTDSVSGTATAPITVCGTRSAVLDGGSLTTGYVLHVTASNVRVAGITVTDGLKGVMLDGATDDVLTGLAVSRIGTEGVHFREFSSDDTLSNSVVHDTGLATPKYGEGVYVGSSNTNWCTYTSCRPDQSDRDVITGNVISGTTAESVDIKEGTTGGVVSGNTFNGTGMTAADSWVDVKGNGWAITGNTGSVSPLDGFQTHVLVSGWGDNNDFAGNLADLHSSGLGFRLTGGGVGNVVSCTNTVSDAGGFANVGCA